MADFELLGVGAVSTLVDGVKAYDSPTIRLSEDNGYINASGGINTQTSTVEVYTTQLDVRPFERLRYAYALSSEQSMWLVYGTYDESGTFLSRVAIVSNVTGSGSSGTIEVPSNVAFMSFSYRTFGESGVFSVIGEYKQAAASSSSRVGSVLGSAVMGRNLFDVRSASHGYIEPSSGSLNPAHTCGEMTSDFIPVSAGDAYAVSVTATASTVTGGRGASLWYAFYDSSKSYVSGSGKGFYNVVTGLNTISKTVTVPSGAYYMRVSARLWQDGYATVMEDGIDADDASLALQFGSVRRDIIAVDRPFGRLMMSGFYGAYIDLDTKNKWLVIPRDCILLRNSADMAGGTLDTSSMKVISSEVHISYAALATSAVKFVYSQVEDEFYSTAYSSPLRHFDDVIIAAGRVQNSNVLSLSCSCPWSIDGLPYNLNTSDEYAVSSVNHRGYGTAPENTLPAFRLSKRRGFDAVECDVRFTSDGTPVLLHDESINRTARNANGTELSSTVNIASITYEQASGYDFGVYKGSQYAGTKIPTFAQFLALCRGVGLRPYVELKVGTQASIHALVDAARANGMSGKVSWISFNTTLLGYVKDYDATARLGVVTDSVTSSTITAAQGLATETNEVFVDSGSYTASEVTLCQNAGLPLEVWTVNDASTIAALPTYVTGVTSDTVHAGKALYAANM